VMRTRIHLVSCAAWALAVVAMVTAPGCARSSASCGAGGAALRITASNSRFDTDCLAAPSSRPFTRALDNKHGGVTHDVLLSIAFNPGSTVLFDGTAVTGPRTITYHVGALAAGTYSFECSLHPGFKHGTFIVAAAASPSADANP
jgi:hypothetical protein